MFLKNVSKELVEIKYDGVVHAIPAGATISIETIYPGADLEAGTGLLEKFESETKGKLAKVAGPTTMPEAKKSTPRGRGRAKRG